MAATGSEFYRVVPSTWTPTSQVAVARRFSTFAEALSNMGTGVVLGSDGHLAAFHERHLRIVDPSAR